MIYATAKPTHLFTKCTKMQKEEQNRTDVLNGNGDCVSGAADSKDEGPRNSCSHGGRLKFFKDGKFILELERSREGERVSWVSVPRKTFWPPHGTALSTPTYRHESSTSLSVSDDNSSIQSSPWQRDHSWKQTSPRKNQSTELSFYYWCPSRKKPLGKCQKTRRRPWDPCKKEEAVCKVVKKCGKPSLLSVIQTLKEKLSSGSPGRETIVSPRKRILREMEKDCKPVVDEASQKRSRSKPITASTAGAGTKTASPVRSNGSLMDETCKAAASKNSSYSITSLLADDRNAKKSPANSPSHFSPGHHSRHPYSAPEDRWYTESVDKLRSIELSYADKRLYSPFPQSYVPPYILPYLRPHFRYYRDFFMSPGYGGLATAPHPYPAPLPVPVRPEVPSCSWTDSTTRDTEHREENIADMPLNLSKHAS